jgi:drug/metabolite transporter (DMT)-like permease
MLPETAIFLMPLAAAFLFAFAAVVLKLANQTGVDAWQTAFVVNMVGAICYSSLWTLGGPPIQLELWWQPLILSIFLLAGMTLQFLAFDHGEVSIAVPAMGVKILVVALLIPVMIGESIASPVWLAACLSLVGLFFLNWTDRQTPRRGVVIALTVGCAAAFCFGVFDVLIQKWGRQWGGGRLLPCVFWSNAILSSLCFLGFRRPLWAISARGWRSLLLGALLLSLQGILFLGAIATFGRATEANITYATRGMLSVVLVMLVGPWLGIAEGALPIRVLVSRSIGAACILTAVALAAIFAR